MTAARRVRITPMRRRHLRAVERLDRLVQRQPWSLAVLRSELGQPRTRRYVVALVDEAHAGAGTLVGYGGVYLVPPEAHVTTLGVEPSRQRRGIGAMLLDALARASAEAGAPDLTLEVRPSNLAALELYRRAGFLIEGRRPRYYEDGEDALIMWRRPVVVSDPGRSDVRMDGPA